MKFNDLLGKTLVSVVQSVVQACEGLQTRGPTLTAEDDLLAQIRKEWKKFRSNQ